MPEADRELIERSRTGDLEAFDVLVGRHKQRVCRTLFLLLGNRDDVEDVAQEVFIRVYRHIDSFRGDSEFSTWLHKVTINTLRNWLRTRKPSASLQSSDGETRCEVPGESCGSHFLSPEDNIELRKALDSLPLHYKEALVLRHYQELSYEEIAEIQGVPLGTVRSRLAKARQILYGKLLNAGLIQPMQRSVVP